ncbi:hypothetical protein RM704_25865 [Streptomyces sp. DSM 3412]|uniref:Uncharacterized protein n=1 Tax=Streptomyces gottesmaniae TaxID=3075518 RepID=A0ABU2Z3I8_9ACTN|nr:hypothetical protein [Streptomyces sp. DSM 3412]MDT0570844.1 hypothetical protein [Streptomyces sp. DSM 3412]
MAAVSLQLLSEPGKEFDGSAFITTFWWMTALLLVPFALALLLPRRAASEARACRQEPGTPETTGVSDGKHG